MHTIDETIRERIVTSDSIFTGAVTCKQFRDGYRFSIDAILAAHFHEPARGERVLDLGAGCGIISLIMMYRWGERITSLHALEYQPQLCELIRENFQSNGYGEKCTCINGDVKRISVSIKPESFSHVVCNPPFFRTDSGRSSAGEESRIARHQVTADLDDFSQATASAVKNGGTAVFVYPAESLTHLIDSLSRAKLEVKNMQFIYSYPESTANARLVLVKCIKNSGKGVKIAAPFYIYEQRNGNYSGEMQKLYLP